MLKRIFIAATGQHVGKTTSTLGLMSALKRAGVDVGYCKPVGQKWVPTRNDRVDKDAMLFSQAMQFELAPRVHSPVILAKGVTAAYNDHPREFDFWDLIERASAILEERYQLVVYEGTGHPGVGSIVDLSNADVAKRLNAPVIMIGEGGIGKAFDKLNADMALFREKRVPIAGAIINKVKPEKMGKVKHYVGERLRRLGIPVLGLIPYQKTLALPIMETISEAVDGHPLVNEEQLANPVEEIISGALAVRREFPGRQNILLMVNLRRLRAAMESIEQRCEAQEQEAPLLSGILLTYEQGDWREARRTLEYFPYISEHRIPVIGTQLDTFGSAQRITQLEVKINTRTPWKVQKAVELFCEHVDLGPILRGRHY